MKYSQSDIVEVVFPLPNGQFKRHPAIIISNRAVYEAEEIYYCVMLSTKSTNDEFIFEITPSMVNFQSDKISYAKCQLISQFAPNEIMMRFGSLKSIHFKKLLLKLNESVFSFEINIV